MGLFAETREACSVFPISVDHPSRPPQFGRVNLKMTCITHHDGLILRVPCSRFPGHLRVAGGIDPTRSPRSRTTGDR